MACDLCGSSSYEVLWDKTEREKQGILRSVVIRNNDGNIIHGRNVICKNCGLVYVEPKIGRDELKKFYEEDYRKIYTGGLSLESENVHAETAYGILKTTLPMKPRRLLDIGCSTGRLLEMAYWQGLARPYGIEPNKEHYDVAVSKLGENVQNTTIEDYCSDIKFDIITMLNALEHVYSPTEVLKKINSILADDGYLLISVPNLYGKDIRQPVDVFLSNAHLYAFTIPTIKAYFSKCGFKVVKFYGVMESIGEKLYVLGQKAEPEYRPPAFDMNELLAVRQHLDLWDQVFLIKEQILKIGYK